jgi:hypothetical protein
MKTLFTLLFACTSLQASVVTLDSTLITTTVTNMEDYYLYEYNVVPRINIYSVKNPSTILHYRPLSNITLYVDYDVMYDQYSNKSYDSNIEYGYRLRIDDIEDTENIFIFTYKSPYAPVESYTIINHGNAMAVEKTLTPGTVCIPEPSSVFLCTLPALLLIRRKRNG